MRTTLGTGTGETRTSFVTLGTGTGGTLSTLVTLETGTGGKDVLVGTGIGAGGTLGTDSGLAGKSTPGDGSSQRGR